MFPKRFYWILVLLLVSVGIPTAYGAWEPAGLEGKSIVALAVSPTDNNLVFAAVTDEGIYRTTDGGMVWQKVWSGTDAIYVITFDRQKKHIIYAGLDGAVLRSTDGGLAFEKIAAGKGIEVRSIVLDEVSYKGIYLATTQGVYKSMDMGNSWRSAGLQEHDISSLAVRSTSPRSKPVIYATTREGGIYKTKNLGLSWAPSNNGLTDTEIVAILCDIKLPQKLYAASFATGVYMSDDGGQNWSHVSTGIVSLNGITLAQAVDPKTGRSVIYVANYAGEVYKSADSGSSWTSISTELGKSAVGLSMAIANVLPTTLYLGTTDGVLKLESD